MAVAVGGSGSRGDGMVVVGAGGDGQRWWSGRVMGHMGGGRGGTANPRS